MLRMPFMLRDKHFLYSRCIFCFKIIIFYVPDAVTETFAGSELSRRKSVGFETWEGLRQAQESVRNTAAQYGVCAEVLKSACDKRDVDIMDSSRLRTTNTDGDSIAHGLHCWHDKKKRVVVGGRVALLWQN